MLARRLFLSFIALLPLTGQTADAPPLQEPVRFGAGGLRHTDRVNCVAYSPDGKTVASCSADGSVCLWDVASGKALTRWREQFAESTPLSVTFSPDGATLAASDNAGRTRIFELPGGNELRALQIEGSVNTLAFSPDGKLLAGGCGDGKVRIWRGTAAQPAAELSGHIHDVVSVSFSHNGELLCSSGIDQTVRIWDMASGKELRTLRGHADTITAARFSPDGKVLASSSKDKTVRFWRVNEGTELSRLDDTFPKMVYALAFSPDGKTLVTGNESVMVDLWNVESGRRLSSFGQHWGSVNSVAFSPDGSALASGGNDGRVRLWNVKSGKQQGREDSHSEEVLAIAFSPDGSLVATGGKDDYVRLWDARDGKFIRRFEQDSQWIFSLKFAPDGKSIATGTRNGTASVFEVATGKRTAWLMPAHVSQYLAMTYSADGSKLMGAGLKDSVDIWDLAEKKQIASFRVGHENYALSLAPGGKLLAISGADPNIRLYDAQNGRLVFAYAGAEKTVRAIAYSPDGSWLAAGSDDGKIYVWEVSSGMRIAILEGHAGPVNALVFVDNNRVASGSADHDIAIWDLISGNERRVLKGHTGGVNALAYEGASRRLVSGGDDLAGMLWNVPAAGSIEAQKVLSENELEKLWLELTNNSGAEVLEGLKKICAGGKESVAFLQKKLQPDVLEEVRKRIIDLDHDDFETRESAFEALVTLDAIALNALKEAAASDSAEVSQSANRLLTRLSNSIILPLGPALARLRALQVLAAIGTPEALAALEQIRQSGLSELEKTQAARLLGK